MVLVTNHLAFGSTTIAQIYKEIGQIEFFFRYLKQNLRIKTFVGTSANALQIQIWTALIAMLLLKYLQLRSSFGWSLSNLTARSASNCLFTETYTPGWTIPSSRRRRWKAGTTANWHWSSECGYWDSRVGIRDRKGGTRFGNKRLRAKIVQCFQWRSRPLPANWTALGHARPEALRNKSDGRGSVRGCIRAATVRERWGRTHEKERHRIVL